MRADSSTPSLPSDTSYSESIDHVGLFRLGNLGMLVYGMSGTLTGTSLPAIIAGLGLSLADAGALTGLSNIGFVISVFTAGILIERVGMRAILLGGAGLAALSLSGFALAPAFAFALAANTCLALGSGFLETSLNALVAHVGVHRAGTALNALHLFFGVGAFAGPILIGLLLSFNASWRVGYLATAALLAGFALLISRRRLPSPPADAEVDWGVYLKLVRRPSIALSWISMFLYVAAELGLVAWLATYLSRAGNYPAGLAAAALSAFWLAMVAGRYLGSRFATPGTYRKLVVGGAMGGAICSFALLLSFQPVLVFAAVLGAGLCFASQFPTILAHASDENPGQAGAVSGIIVTAVGLGAMAGPWVIGITANAAGLGWAMSLIGGLMLAIVVIFWRA